MMRSPFWLSRAEVREVDRRAIDEYGMSGLVLMENAGRGAAELFAQLNPNYEPTLILCGRGNNGGDGFVIARHLQNLGIHVEIVLFADDPEQLSPDCRANYEIARKADLILRPAAEAISALNRVYWVIDCLFGTGLDRPLQGRFDELIQRLNQSNHGILAIDIPSGLDCDTGLPLGSAIKANFTATFVAPKKGFLNPESQIYTGEVHVVGIGVPKKLIDEFRNLPDESE